MKEIDYPYLIKMITDHEINVEGLWLEDQNGTQWFWKDGNFCTGMNKYDTEPPLIYLTDKYNIQELYQLRFKIPEIKKPNKQSNKLTIEDIIDKFSNKQENVKLIDHNGDMWEYVPLAKSIMNENGESITDFFNETTLSAMDFEILYQEKSLDKPEARDEVIKEIQTHIDILEEEFEHLKKLFKLYGNLS